MANISLSVDPRKYFSTKRLSKKITAVIFLIGFTVLAAIFMGIASKGGKKETAKASEQPIQTGGQDVSQGLQSILSSAPQAAMIEEKESTSLMDTVKETAQDVVQEKTPDDLIKEALAKEWINLRKIKTESYIAALKAPITIEKQLDTNTNQNIENNPQLKAAKEQLKALESQQIALNTAQVGTGNNSGVLDGYLDNFRQPLLSPYELNVGTLIPAVTLGQINSDIAGTIKAQITQTVYDSATGAIALLPQGAELVGQYSGKVAFGQERLPVQWYRINFPDGSKLNLRGMDGADSGGQNGFEGDVNNHYWRLFGQSTLLGLIAGGTTAAVSTDSNNNENSPSQTIANGIISQYAQTGSTLIQKNLQISPTITVPSGYEFNIILTKDVVLPPYQQR